MTESDRSNLMFLLQAKESTIRDWYSKVGEDDKKYASALLTCFSWELLDDITDCSQAKEYLSKL